MVEKLEFNGKNKAKYIIIHIKWYTIKISDIAAHTYIKINNKDYVRPLMWSRFSNRKKTYLSH